MSAQPAQPVYAGDLPEGLKKISNIIAVSSCKARLGTPAHIERYLKKLLLVTIFTSPGRSWKIYRRSKSRLYLSWYGGQGWDFRCRCLWSKLTKYGFSSEPAASGGKPDGWIFMLTWNLVFALIMVNRLTFRTQKAKVFFRPSIWESNWCLLALLDKEERSCEVQWFQESLISC